MSLARVPTGRRWRNDGRGVGGVAKMGKLGSKHARVPLQIHRHGSSRFLLLLGRLGLGTLWGTF